MVAHVKVRHGVVELLPLHAPQSHRKLAGDALLRLLELVGAELLAHALRLLHVLGRLQQQVFLQAGERLRGSQLLIFAAAIVVPGHRILQRVFRFLFLSRPPVLAVLVALLVPRVIARQLLAAVELQGGRHPVGDFEMWKA